MNKHLAGSLFFIFLTQLHFPVFLCCIVFGVSTEVFTELFPIEVAFYIIALVLFSKAETVDTPIIFVVLFIASAFLLACGIAVTIFDALLSQGIIPRFS